MVQSKPTFATKCSTDLVKLEEPEPPLWLWPLEAREKSDRLRKFPVLSVAGMMQGHRAIGSRYTKPP